MLRGREYCRECIDAVPGLSQPLLLHPSRVLTYFLQLNPTAWGWRGKTGFFWAVTCVLGFAFTFWYIPEPKDRTIAELDLLFERKVRASKFKETRVEIAEMAGNDDGKED